MATLTKFTPGAWRPSNPLDVFSRVGTKLVDSRGQWTPYLAAAELFDTMEIRTKITPPIKINIRTLEDPTPNPLLNQIKPAIILRGPIGTQVIAPYGEVPDANAATYNAQKLAGIGVAGLLGVGILGFLIGSLRTRREYKKGKLGDPEAIEQALEEAAKYEKLAKKSASKKIADRYAAKARRALERAEKEERRTYGGAWSF